MIRTAFSGAKLSLTPAREPFPVGRKGSDTDKIKLEGWKYFDEKC